MIAGLCVLCGCAGGEGGADCCAAGHMELQRCESKANRSSNAFAGSRHSSDCRSTRAAITFCHLEALATSQPVVREPRL